MKNFIAIVLIIFCMDLYSQPNLTEKEAFFYALRVNHLSPNDIAYGNMGTSYQWIDLYSLTFDNANYINSKNDEFKKQAYRTKILQEINDGIRSVDFNKEFSYIETTDIGKYNMETGSFPIFSDAFQSFPSYFFFDTRGFQIKIGKIFNYADFDFVLKMDYERAESFIDSRKDYDGNIDRSIDARIIFSVVDKNFKNSYHFVYFGILVFKIEIYNNGEPLGVLYPRNISLNDQKQENLRISQDSAQVYMVSDSMPTFPGGETALNKFINENIKYPKAAKENGIQGRVFVTFIVEKDGSITDIRVLRSIGYGADEEAVRLVNSMPNWIPGTQNGKAVRVQYNLPIKFNLAL